VPFYYAMLGILAISMLVSWFIRGSKLGLALFAIRDDEDRARGLGVQTEFAKLTSFAVSAGLVAMAGGVWAYYIAFIYPQFAVDPLVTIGMVLMVYLGGRGTIWGPVLGAFILVPAQQYLAYRLGASELYLVGYSAVFLVVMLLMPRGILPSLHDRTRRMRMTRQPPGRQPEEATAS
jgi:branched-chain amino acid transport system permease protein